MFVIWSVWCQPVMCLATLFLYITGEHWGDTWIPLTGCYILHFHLTATNKIRSAGIKLSYLTDCYNLQIILFCILRKRSLWNVDSYVPLCQAPSLHNWMYGINLSLFLYKWQFQKFLLVILFKQHSLIIVCNGFFCVSFAFQ